MAHVDAFRVRETSITNGTSDFLLAGAVRGSLAFSEVMIAGDTCDYVAHYDDSFEEGVGTFAAGPTLQRTSVYKAHHANGTVDTNKVAFAVGVKTIILTVAASRAIVLRAAVRYDIEEVRTDAERSRAQRNIGFSAGTEMLFRNTTAPIGWTKGLAHNDKAIRVVSGVPTPGGSSPFSTVFGKTATDGTTITTTTFASHAHGINGGTGSADGGGLTYWNNHSLNHSHTLGGNFLVSAGSNLQGDAISNHMGTPSGLTFVGANVYAINWVPGGDTHGSHTHSIGLQGGGGSHTHPMDIRVQYIDVIYAIKD